jgi:hypothetical protein
MQDAKEYTLFWLALFSPTHLSLADGQERRIDGGLH